MESAGKSYTHNEQLLLLKEQFLKEAEDLFNGSNWTAKKEKDGVKWLDRDEKWNDRPVKGCEGEIGISWANLTALITDPEVIVANAKVQGRKVQETRVVEHVDEQCIVLYELHKPPFPVSKREIITLRCLKELDDGRKLSITKSIPYSTIPEDKYVRAECHFNCFLVEDLGNGSSKIRSCGYFDPRGSIPEVLKKKADEDHYRRVKIIGDSLGQLKKNGTLA
mmetsp:Transcript_4705/g.5315  ORF Transcript_4705/g.5315 Transcript_4705/m.5315 type:complete len:222 (+) Transcript_4705:73-738(+)